MNFKNLKDYVKRKREEKRPMIEEIKCSHCGAPIAFMPGEPLATCKYCGFASAIETPNYDVPSVRDQAKPERDAQSRNFLDKLVDPRTTKQVSHIVNQTLARLNNDEPFRLPKLDLESLSLPGHETKTSVQTLKKEKGLAE